MEKSSIFKLISSNWRISSSLALIQVLAAQYCSARTGIDLAGTSPLPRDGLPLMRTMEVDIQLLSTPEGIALGSASFLYLLYCGIITHSGHTKVTQENIYKKISDKISLTTDFSYH